MKRSINKAAVLGAGVMGATIAGHLANVGIPTYLLDIVPGTLNPDEEKKGLTLESPQVRNRFAVNGIANLLKAKPAPLYVPENAFAIIGFILLAAIAAAMALSDSSNTYKAAGVL
ncbi:MAG: 3-hydroxyacyl-CoA dehydrogenase NAD-binding domain-containing protein, partial [Desulfocucumaceae bacterium]